MYSQSQDRARNEEMADIKASRNCEQKFFKVFVSITSWEKFQINTNKM